ncbi:14671_t:CDS:1, partial [Racocetra persica]
DDYDVEENRKYVETLKKIQNSNQCYAIKDSPTGVYAALDVVKKVIVMSLNQITKEE